MPTTYLSVEELAADPARAEKAIAVGPVLLTTDGRPAFALSKIENPAPRPAQDTRTLLEVMDSLPCGDFDFDPPRMDGFTFRPADLE